MEGAGVAHLLRCSANLTTQAALHILHTCHIGTRTHYVLLWQEANPREKWHLNVFASKAKPNAFKSTASISSVKSDIRGLTRAQRLLQSSHGNSTDKLYQ